MLSASRLVEFPPVPLNLIEIDRLSPIIDCARAVQSVARYGPISLIELATEPAGAFERLQPR
jgi:hypothetical protein